MDTNQNNISVNVFNKGMNTDASYANIQEGQYLYAENLRNYTLNRNNDNNNTNQYSSIQAIEGCDWNSFNDNIVDFNNKPFHIDSILAADTIRNIGIIIVKGRIEEDDSKQQWAVVRAILSDEKTLEDVKIIYLSGTDAKNQLDGEKVSIVLKYETEENIKLYIADGKHFMLVLNVAEDNDGHNEKISGDLSKIENIQCVFLNPIKFLGLTTGNLTAGVVQYAYRLYDQNGSASPMSCITNTIQLVQNEENSNSQITKGGSKGKYIGCGVKLQIKLESQENSAYNHIEIYRIYYEEGGQLPKVGVIYNKKIPQSETIDYTDFGQQYLSEITVDEFNNISGIHIIPKVLESKNGRLFAANIKDSASSLNDIANHFDARAFRFNRQNKAVYSQYSDQNTTYSKTREDIDKENYDSKNDTSDYFNKYNDITKTFNIEDDICRLGELTEDKTAAYYGGYGKNIKWRFVITELVGDYSNVGNPQGERETEDSSYKNVGAVGNTLITNYEESSDKVKPLSYDNKLKYGYVIQNLKTGDNSMELHPEIDYTDLFESSNKTCTYSNSCISYGFRSLKRDELYRFGIVLYNKRNEATPVMWIGDVRTPPCNEKCFDTYESNVHNTSLVVRPLGIEFKVDLTSINDYIAKNDDYNELDQIVAYEIVRCYRSSKDVQNIAQGVLSRPVRKTKNEYAANVKIDPVYTPTGILTTQSYWNGESWVSHNGCLKNVWGDGDKLKNANGYEADNFDNHTLFQFICPEACYNGDYMKNIIDNTNLSIQPFFYVFGQGKGKTHDLDTCNELIDISITVDGNYVQKDPRITNHKSLQSYYYTSTAWSNNQQPLPPYATYYDLINKEHNPYLNYGVDVKKYPEDYLPVDQFVLQSNGSGFIDDSIKLVLFAPSDKEGKSIDQSDYPKLKDNQLFFIYDSYGRTAINYFENKARTRNGQDLIVGTGIYNTDKKYHCFRMSVRGDEYLTYKTPERHYKGSADVGSLGVIATPAYKNYMNCVQYCYGYSKLYEKTPFLYTRAYGDSNDTTNKLFGDANIVNSYNIKGTEKYNVKDAIITNALGWDDIFSADTQNGTASWSYKYNDYVQPIGTSTYCNIIMGGKYGESKYLTKDKEQGLFNSEGSTKISYGDMPSGLVGTAGNSILINLESDNNILYKNVATDRILKHSNQMTSLSDYELWYGYIYEHPATEQKTLYSTTSPYEVTVDEAISEASRDKRSIYDNVRCGKDEEGYELIESIYRSSIAGTYLCNLKQNTVPYNGYQYTSRLTNTYVSCGNYYKYNPNEKKIVFNGDCYIQPFEYVSAHKYYYKDVKSPVTTCLVYTFPVETNINIIASHGHEFSKNLDNKGLCTNLQQQPSNVNDIYAQDDPEYVYNTAYSQQPNAQTHETIDISDDSNTLSYVDYRCYYSELKSNNENIDSWQVFKPANFLDVDDRYGEITHLRTFNNMLMFWQEHATGQFSVNERSQISDDSGKPIVLGVGDVLSRYDYIDYTTGMHKEQYCDTCSNTSLYWFDSHNDEIKTLSGNGVVQLNKQYGTQNIMHEQSGIVTPVMFYDKKYNEVVSKVLHGQKDKSIAYNEMIQAFTSVYDLDFENHLTFDNDIYLLNVADGKLNIGHWNNGTRNVDTKLKYVVNASPTVTKVFDNQEIVTEQYDNNIDNCRFTWYTEISGDTTYEQPKITNREGNYRYSLPRVGQNAVYGNRLRGKYMIGEIDNIITPISYIITKFRKSCS